jgi:hypothetical protein
MLMMITTITKVVLVNKRKMGTSISMSIEAFEKADLIKSKIPKWSLSKFVEQKLLEYQLVETNGQ